MTEADLLRCELLVLRHWRRDEAAARELTELFQAPILYYLRRLLRSEADAWDVAQETWLAAFRSLSTLRDRRTFPAFLYRIARNKAITHLRQRRAADAALMERAEWYLEGEEIVDGEEGDFSTADAASVHRALDELSLPHREVLTLFFLKDLSIKQISEIVGSPEGTVKSRLFHAKRALRLVLQEET
jgi:RNA polymerase sigma factor (sigma-70 family)